MTAIQTYIDQDLSKELAVALVNEGRIQGDIQTTSDSILLAAHYKYRRSNRSHFVPDRYKEIHPVAVGDVYRDVTTILWARGKWDDGTPDYVYESNFLLMELHLLKAHRFKTFDGYKKYLAERIFAHVMGRSFLNRKQCQTMVDHVLNSKGPINSRTYRKVKSIIDQAANDPTDPTLYWMLKLWNRHWPITQPMKVRIAA